ncbi:class II glutamine amidotransferase [Microterricola pindariensis]|uniref:Class II glutamine amidotransferase n=1 Tax=Microterricola pindariensis TaxID=478010 RepID=A0ABX5AUZ7_9MICO|nr:class II glutamine amidotransferase [Microterricola pindariensis]PPL18765.1 class II glutamine amidotransferase [Microterricola pindariensis]
MCRWLAYTGEPLQASTVILDAQHSLVAQSLDSPLGNETVNGDGFGFGWYPENAHAGDAPAFFRSIEPAWNDQNLRELTRSVRSPLFFSHVRAAAGPPIQQTNCHPFRHQNWMFMHNGFLDGFAKMKRDLTFAVDPSLYPTILGTTDSEVLFNLALTLGLTDDPIAAMGEAIRMVEAVGRERGIAFPMQGTLAVTDGVTVWAFRYSSQGRTRTLFHSVDVDTVREMYPGAERLKLFGSRARLIVSEPLNNLPGVFNEVPESTVAVVDASGYHHEPFLATND